MPTVAAPPVSQAGYPGSDRTIADVVDRWIYVFMAVLFVLITLAGFIPDSLTKLTAIEAGERPPFPLVLHVHSVLMGSFLLLLLAQSTLAATGRLHYHQRLGIAAVILAPAIVVAGFISIQADGIAAPIDQFTLPVQQGTRISVFEYLGVILSVIMGLGLTHILAGLSKTIHQRRTVKPYWVHTVWAFNALIYIVVIWWGMFWWSNQQDWLFYQFLLLIVYAIVLFLLASLLYPWDFSDDFDFEKHFFETRPWFFSVLAIAWVIDIPETVLKSNDNLRDLPPGYFLLASSFIALGVVGALWSNKTYHKIIAVLWGTFTIIYLSATTLREIAAG